MVGAISAYGVSYNPYLYQSRTQPQASPAAQSPSQTAQPAQASGTQQANNVWTARRAAQPETPVQPVRPVTSVNANASQPVSVLPSIREGVDPVEMAVRMRIQYPDAAGVNAAGESGQKAELGADAVQAAAKEGECQTCEKRKYQDGSDDMGVSFQTPTRVDPDLAASAVRGHEMEHVVREQAKAQREDRRVVSQNVTYHTAICPECGKAYVSGGTTRTVTAANSEQQTASQQGQENPARVPFSAVA